MSCAPARTISTLASRPRWNVERSKPAEKMPSRPRRTVTAAARSAASSASPISPSISLESAFTFPSSSVIHAIPSSIRTRVFVAHGAPALPGAAGTI